MFTVAAVLPFLPLIEDAMIRQLGDNDFAKREAATRVLERMLKDTDGLRNYWILAKVIEATTDSDAEVRTRVKELSAVCQSRQFYNRYDLLLVVFNSTARVPREFI